MGLIRTMTGRLESALGSFWRGLTGFLKCNLGPTLKNEFVPTLALANSMCRKLYPGFKWLVSAGQAHALYPKLYQECVLQLYKRGNRIFVGRGFPLWSEGDVIAIVRRCGSADEQKEKAALNQWRSLVETGAHNDPVEVIETAQFDDYLNKEVLPSIECSLKGLAPLPGCAKAPFLAIRSYVNLPDEMKVLVLYLHYRSGRKGRCTLCKLIESLDWDYLARIIDDPDNADDVFNPRRKAVIACTAHLLDDALSDKTARDFVLSTLKAQPLAAHRALAQEFETIHGLKARGKTFKWSPTNRIEEKLPAFLHFTDPFEGPRNDPRSETAEVLSALCLSGGGIRSASFCLGAIQTLAAHKLFGQFHYISTVSGGGYIGTALTRWMQAKWASDGKTPQAALEYSEDELTKLRSKDYVHERVSGLKFEQEGALTWLRMNSNYLARRLSLFSADAWTIVATYLRNLLIVWFIFWPWFAVFLWLPWFAVWYGRVGACTAESCSPMTLGAVGAVIGALGATYFYQGIPDDNSFKYANLIGLPKGGDKRAALGAVMLVLACFFISHAMWADVDISQGTPERFSELLHDYRYIVLAIMVTQFPLALGNTAWFAPEVSAKYKSLLAMLLAALLASAVQITLIICIRMSLDIWHLHLGVARGVDPVLLPPPVPPGISVVSMIRALATPALMLLSLLVGEAVKAATRSWTEKPDRREHQGRAHAFVFMMLSVWVTSAVLVIGVPAVLASLGGNVPGATAAGSAVSLAVSTWLGYRKSSPGKPEARTPVSLTLIGSAGMLLLAVLISLSAWKTFEHLAVSDSAPFRSPIPCQCANLTDAQKSKVPPPATLLKGYSIPATETMCGVASAQCIDRGSRVFVDEIVRQFDENELKKALKYLACSAIFFFLFAMIIRMNEFSLHGFYRDRLIRAFYGGFRAVNEPRQPATFTGFDGKDDISLTELKPLYDASLPKFHPGEGASNKPPFLVVNAALNLVKGTELAWQERKADSFTFTPLTAGNYRLGYRDVERFAQGVRLGTAMAISGAAFNPNMGYNSSTPMAFLMSVFNVRLGWWLGNPRYDCWERKDPGNSSWVMLQEATGQTTDTNDWIHLSDGGHFDNMGLWEMVRRRCRRIMVIDASQDEAFSLEDLYSAIRKIRVDMGIEIAADEVPVLLFPRSARAAGQYYARFTIRYGGTASQHASKDGTLLYLKPCVYGSEPPDIQEYAHKHLDFPHETTADQFFNESQFESYRKLGEWEMAQLLRDALGLTGKAQPTGHVPMGSSPDGTKRGLFPPRS